MFYRTGANLLSFCFKNTHNYGGNYKYKMDLAFEISIFILTK